jgi:hypothetical protein
MEQQLLVDGERAGVDVTPAQTVFSQQMLLAALSLFAGLLVARSALAGRRPADA